MLGLKNKRKTKMRLSVCDIECYAFHGCMDEEGKIGQRFSVDVIIDFDFSESVSSDDLSDTADYVELHNRVRKEMAIQSKLIEHAAGRILNSMKEYMPNVRAIKVIVTKYNPPVNGRIGKAVVEVGYSKN